MDYTNYKAQMWTMRRGETSWENALHSVWAAMHAVERPRITQDDRESAAKAYPNQTWTDEDIEMLKGMGHI